MLTRKPYTQKDFDWTAWTPQQIKKRSRAIINTLKINNATIKMIPKDERTFANTILDSVDPRTFSDMSTIELLMELSPRASVRSCAQEASQYMHTQMIDISYDPDMYRAVLEYDALSIPEKKTLRPADKKLLQDIIKRYKRMGFDLPVSVQKKIKELKKKITTLESTFNKNLNDYHVELLVSKEELDGLPVSFIQGLKKKQGKYVLTLDYPVVGPVLKFATSPKVRKQLADMNEMKGGKKNLVLLQKIVALRHQTAQLLGYQHHADYVIEENMAQNAKTVTTFLEQLVPTIQKEGKKALAELAGLKKADGYKDAFQYYDTTFYSARARLQKFNIDQEVVREYFPMDHVMKQSFDIFGKLYGIRFTPVTLPVWHADVLTYKVTDTKTKSLVGYCAFDLYPRKGKFSHMACSNVIHGQELAWQNPRAGYQAPFSVILGNFNPPSKKRPSLLSHGEVRTFFHECGHLLHGLLTEAPFYDQSGTSVAHDFVELPSQIMENWVWDPAMLKKLSKHYRTGKSLPNDMIQNICNSRLHLESIATGRLLALSLFDMTLHTSAKKYNMPELMKKLKYALSGIAQPKESIYPAGFGHLTGGYDAGYYSYAWALVYAYDCFSRFQKEGIMNEKVGHAFRKEILAVGSSRDEMQSLKAFLGRVPSQKAFTDSLAPGALPQKKTARKK